MKDPYKTDVPLNNAENSFCDMPSDSRQSDMVRCGSQRQSFDPSVSFANLEMPAIKQTGKGDSWFSEAHKNDVRLGRQLGTLGYLPLEIRQQIWCATIDNYKHDFWQNHVKHIEEGSWFWGVFFSRARRWFERPLDCHSSRNKPRRHIKSHDTIIGFDVFDLSSYHKLNPDSTEGGAMHLRYASPEAKVELENMFIYTNTFRFFCQKVMNHFLSQLSAYQQSLLRSIIISPMSCPHCRREDTQRNQRMRTRRSWFKARRQAWVESIKRLPATLKNVTFELRKGEFRIPLNSATERIERANFLLATKLLEITTKNARRQAPGACIVLDLSWHLKAEDSEFLESTCEVAPYSEHFMTWSIQSWWDAMNQGAED